MPKGTMHILDIKREIDRGKNIWDIPIKDKVLAVKTYHGYTQEEYAELLDISRTYYGTLERGEHYNPKYLLGIAIDNQLLEILYGTDYIAKKELIDKLSTLFKCIQRLKFLIENDTEIGKEQSKYANMALKYTQIIASRIKGKGEV